VSGVQELVDDGITGYTFSLDDLDSLHKALRRFLMNEEGKTRSNARRLVEKCYSMSFLAERYERLYTELLQKRGKGSGESLTTARRQTDA
jgi:glycosyltransferase involved in cell wall biosynthesis